MKVLITGKAGEECKELSEHISMLIPDADATFAADIKEACEKLISTEYEVIFILSEQSKISGNERYIKELTLIKPDINLIFVSDSDKYAMCALDVYASGYILRPLTEGKVEGALNHLRYPIKENGKGLYIQCFGAFEVFYDKEPVHFHRSRAKEILAYLVSLNGVSATGAEICRALWGDEKDFYNSKNRDHFYHIYNSLEKTLDEYGARDILIRKYKMYAVDKDRVRCDYFEALQRNGGELKDFKGTFMKQYKWANLK